MRRDGVPAVGLLGPVRIEKNGRRLESDDFESRKVKQVFEIVSVHLGEAVPKDRIVELLWGAEQPRDPMRTLEAYVSLLRRDLAPFLDGPLVVTARRAYRLDVEAADLDIHRFDLLTKQARAAEPPERLAMRRRALDLVRGELLADEPYADWVQSLRGLYQERVLRLLLDTAEDSLAAGEPESAAHYAAKVLETEPTRERAHRLLVAALYAAGDQDRALAAYDRCREVLDEELGVRPLAETERVFVGVLQQRPAEELLPSPAPAVHLDSPPRTRFARNGDTTIAYQVLGEGPTDVIFAHAWFSHAEIGWEEPKYAAWLRHLARNRRVIVFDRRGMGMSDPAPATVTLAERADDIRAVLDAAGSEHAVAFGSCGAGPMTMALAQREPDRLAGLVLFGTFARLLAAPDYPSGWSEKFFADYQAGLEQGWLTGRGIVRSVPSAGPDEALMEWLGRLLRLSVSPAAARAILAFGASIDVRDLLSDIRVPTLVLHRTDDQWVQPENGRFLAERIPGARFHELPGADHWPWFGDSTSVLTSVEQFLGELSSG